MPDAGTGEAVDNADTQLLSSSSRVFHFFDAAFVHASRVTISPDIVRQNGLVTSINVIQNALPDQMVADGVQFQVVLIQQISLFLAITVIRQSFGDFEVVA